MTGCGCRARWAPKIPIELTAPAKVNLAREVTGRRPDGYHEVVSVAQTIDLADRVVLDLATTIELEVAGEKLLGGPLGGPANLAHRPARPPAAAAGRAHLGAPIRL